MKKTLLFAAAVLALAACSKESLVKEDGVIDASKIVFNIQVENADATKGIKTAWESGDVIYLFFEDSIEQYVKMTYNGTTWTYSDKDSGTDYVGLSLSASGKKLSAVYFPGFVYNGGPEYYYKNAPHWRFGKMQGFFQTALSEYTVTEDNNAATLNAVLKLKTLYDDLVQVFIPSTEVAKMPLTDGEEYVLNVNNICPVFLEEVTFDGIENQAVVSSYATTSEDGPRFPLTGYFGSMGGEQGYYFWGSIFLYDEIDYEFQLVKRNKDKKYAISSMSKTVPGKRLSDPTAIKLTNLTYNGHFVSLGYEGGPLWATGNLDATNKTIVDPLEAGEYFMYGKTTPYNSSNAAYSGTENPLSTDNDAAYQANNAWRTPTKAQFNALINGSNTSRTWESGWTNNGEKKGGRLITSKVNGISLFLASTGSYQGGVFVYAGEAGTYWSSTPYETDPGKDYAYFLNCGDGYYYTYYTTRFLGFPIRPVKN